MDSEQCTHKRPIMRTRTRQTWHVIDTPFPPPRKRRCVARSVARWVIIAPSPSAHRRRSRGFGLHAQPIAQPMPRLDDVAEPTAIECTSHAANELLYVSVVRRASVPRQSSNELRASNEAAHREGEMRFLSHPPRQDRHELELRCAQLRGRVLDFDETAVSARWLEDANTGNRR